MRSLLCVLAVAGCSAPTKMTSPSTPEGTAPSWFLGAWRREWVQPKGEPAFENHIVRDLQTPTIFGSVRIPMDRPAFAGASSFDGLDDAQLATLLAQRGGFSGTASFAGTVATWNHEIDFQPPGEPDTAHLAPRGPTTVYEEALDGSASELWWSLSSGDGRYLGIKITRGGRTERILTVVGDHFVYARNRARDLPVAESLVDLAASTHATRTQIIELLDCELSYGVVRGGRVRWEVRFSTLPWREGRPLGFATEIAIDAAGTPGPRTPVAGDTWAVPVNTLTRDDLAAVFAP